MNTSVTYGIFRQKLMITYKLNTFISRKKIIKMRSMACLALHRGGNEFIYRGVAGGGGGPESPRNMADQLFLFKPRGEIMPLTLLLAPPGSKSYLHL